MKNRSEIPGSAPQHASEAATGTGVPPDRSLGVTIFVRRRAETAVEADPNDVQAVAAFASGYGIEICSVDPASRRVKVSGEASAFERAFAVCLSSSGNAISYRGPLTVPEHLDGVIVAVLGLDTRPVARPRRRGGFSSAGESTSTGPGAGE